MTLIIGFTTATTSAHRRISNLSSNYPKLAESFASIAFPRFYQRDCALVGHQGPSPLLTLLMFGYVLLSLMP